MITTRCSCGVSLRFPEKRVGEKISCGACEAKISLISAEPLADGVGAGDFDAALIIAGGPERVGERILLGGIPDITVGKREDSHLLLQEPRISRAHCILHRLDFGPSRWQIVDNGSRNGVFVNGTQVDQRELQNGDIITLGGFDLEFISDFKPVPVLPPGPVCPSCEKTLKHNATICTDCGIYIKTGKALVTSKGFDENTMAANADTWIRIASWIVPFGLFPVASEAFGTRKPYATWVIVFITVIASILFWIARVEYPHSTAVANLMLWSNTQPVFNPIRPMGEFHAYQLLTNALLHAGLLHLAGNLVFFFVFGLRVNELIGNVKMAIVYPLLAIASGGVYCMMTSPVIPIPALGASGAIMGMAGMYFIFFPVQKVHVAIWLRPIMFFLLLGPLALLLIRLVFLFRRVMYKVFAMRGLWLLGLWVLLNDVLPVALGSRDHTAHWAHLGGFIFGALFALVLLLTRTVNGRGADLLSLALGRHAWKLLGKPAAREAEGAPVAAIPM